MDNTNVDLDMVSGELIYYSHSLSKDLKCLKLAPTSDAHRGHPNFSLHHFNEHLKVIREQQDVYTVLNGDMCESAIKSSKGNIYKQIGTPQDQRDWVIEKFYPIRHKVLGVTMGNHELRIYNDTGMDICKDIATTLGCPYRAEGMLLRISFGSGNSYHEDAPYVYFVYFCFSEDTEILTKDGWKTHDQIQERELVMTLNKDTNMLEYQPINSIHRYTTHKEMINFKSQNLDLMVTPEHNMLYKFREDRKHNDKWREGTAKKVSELKSGVLIPRAGKMYGKGVPFTDDLIQLVAWIVTEGHFVTISNAIEIRQNAHSPNIKRLGHILNNLKIKFTVDVEKAKGKPCFGKYFCNDDHAKIRICAKDGKWLREIINCKRIPDIFLSDLDNRQSMMFLKELMLGDANCTNDKVLADQMQFLYFKNDVMCSIHPHNSGWNGNEGWSVRPSSKKSGKDATEIYPKLSEKVEYSGISWCVSVDNGTLVVRRNNKIAITGNTHGYGGARTKSAKAVKVERLATYIHADVYLMSHDHVVNVAPDIYLIPDKRTHYDNDRKFNIGKIHACRKMLVKTNAFLKFGDYGESLGYPPVDLITPIVIFAGEGKPKVSVTV